MSDLAPPPLRLAVVGGGVSGLAAAHRLRRLLPGAQLRLFEAGPRLGGPLHTELHGELVLEHGADSFTAKSPWAVDLCRELGLEGELVPTNKIHRRAWVVRRGEPRPVPEGFVIMQPRRWAPLLKSPVLSVAGKVRALAEPWVRTPLAAHAPGYDESVASFASRRLGRQAFERLVEPLMAGIYVADAEELSLAATMPEFLEAERRHGSLRRAARAASNGADAPTTSGARYESFFALRRGTGSLIEALIGALPRGSVILNTPVVELVKGAQRRWRLTAAAARTEEIDGVVIAAPAPQAGKLLERVDPQLAHLLERIDYASSVVVTHIYPRTAIGRPLEAFGLVVPRIEGISLLAASFPSVKFPGRAPDDVVPIRAFLGGALHPEVANLPDAKLAELAHAELRALLQLSAEPRESHVARWPASMPQYHVGHLQQVGAIEHFVAAQPGLELAGSAYRGVGIPQCIHSGQQAAERLATALRPLA